LNPRPGDAASDEGPVGYNDEFAWRLTEAMAEADFDYEKARYNMVEQQIRTWEVLDQDVLDLLFTVRREDYVPPQHRTLAFVDFEIPLPNGSRMWAPRMEARVVQELQLTAADRVLEIGTGSGYLTALLASCAAEVVSAEIDQGTADAARRRLAQHDFANVRVECADGARGYGDEAYDVIVLTGSTPILPERFVEQLRPGGRLFAVVGEAPVMKARLVRWTGPGSRVTADLFETVIQPLRNALAPERFVF
jgi:protein-L-isoaspartate(D-aspartate) O-methyltransferase